MPQMPRRSVLGKRKQVMSYQVISSPGALRQALGEVATQRAAPEGNPVQPLCHRTGSLGACAARKEVYKGWG